MSGLDSVQPSQETNTPNEYDEVMKIAKELRCETKKKTSPKLKSSKKRIGQITKTVSVPTKETDSTSSAVAEQATSSKYTKAELAFKARQEKLREKRILEKAKLTHKQRVEKFNKHLDSLTEHYDIPKVSWTK